MEAMDVPAGSNQANDIKVLIVAATLPIVGGHTVQAEILKNGLNEMPGITAEIQSVNPPFIPALQKLKYIRTLITWPKYIFDLLRNVRHYDIIHIFSASYLSFVISPTPALAASRLFGRPSVLHYHSGEAEDHLNSWRTAVPTIRQFDKVIVPSQYLVDVFARFGLEANAIFNFVDSQKFTFRQRSPLKAVFLSNRNFEAHYNVQCTLRAFQIIQKEHPKAKLIVVGDGPQKESLHGLSAELDLSNVEFRGQIPPEKIAAVYDEADIYLNSSNIDNMPVSIIEAFCAGLPVVTTNAGGIPFIVESERSGLLVEMNDHKALADSALRLLADNEMAQRIISLAREQAQKYSWDMVKEQWVRVYAELILKNQ